MLSKNNRKLQEHKLEQKQRFGFRKYSFGLASALIGVSFMLTTGGTVSADTTTPAETAVAAAATTSSENTSTLGDATSTTASSESTDTKSSEATETASTTATSDSSSTSEATTNDSTVTTSSESTDSSDKSTATSDSSADQSNSSATSDSTSEATNALKDATTATDASANTTDTSTTTATDDAASAEGKFTDEAKAKGLTDSDAFPEMSDANGASLVIDNSKIPDGYEADPTGGRYTFVGLSLGPVNETSRDSKITSYNQEYGTNYYSGKSKANHTYWQADSCSKQDCNC